MFTAENLFVTDTAHGVPLSTEVDRILDGAVESGERCATEVLAALGLAR